jgi:transposase
VEVAQNFPVECRHVLEQLGEVYGNDAEAREAGLGPDERLRFHQQRSGPVMALLHGWLEVQLVERKVEPNSGLGKAITYLLRHWKALTLFLREAGAPLDIMPTPGLCRATIAKDRGHGGSLIQVCP